MDDFIFFGGTGGEASVLVKHYTLLDAAEKTTDLEISSKISEQQKLIQQKLSRLRIERRRIHVILG